MRYATVALACALSVFAGHSIPQDPAPATNQQLTLLVRHLSGRLHAHEELMSRTLPVALTLMEIQKMCESDMRDLRNNVPGAEIDARSRQSALQAIWRSRLHLRMRGGDQGEVDRKWQKSSAEALDAYAEMIDRLSRERAKLIPRRKR